MPELRIGTCSWKFPSWAGLVYSAPKGIDYLEEYARRYDTVEIDQWFWSLFGEDKIGLPRPGDVAAYRRAVPDDFRFTVKAPNSITLTHFYRAAKGDPLRPNPYYLSVELLQEFLRLLEPLREQLGPLIFQFGYLNRQMVASQGAFQEQLAAFLERAPAGYPYALEIRNGNWMNEAYFRFLNDRGLIPVLLQGYWMPSIIELYERWRSLLLQQPTVVVRLLGPDRKGIEEQTGRQWDRIVAPKDDEMAAVVDMAQDLRGAGVDVYLNVNNHYEGSAPLTIERIRALLEGEPVDHRDAR